MIPPWFRVPVQLIQSEPEDARGWIYLLGQWHIGANPGHNEIRRALGWGAGRVQKFIPKVAKWALLHGATVPEEVAEHFRSSSGAVAEQQRSSTGAGQPALIEDNQVVSEQERSTTGANAEQQRSGSRAGDPFREIKRERREEIRSEVRPSVIPDQTPQVHLFPPIGEAPAEPLQAPALAQTPPPAPEAPIKHPGAVSGASQSKPTAPKESTGDTERVWKAWRKIRKGCREEMPQDAKRAMSAALKGNSAEEIEGVIGWVHLGSHDRARFLRGGADPGECNAAKAYGLVTVLRHMGEYLELAKAEGQSSGPIILDADGNVEAPKPQKAPPNRGNSIDSAASTYELAQLLRAEEAKHGFGP